MTSKVVIVCGSKKDLEYVKKIEKILKEFKIETEKFVASAHKTPEKVKEIVKKFENEENLVFITVAGKSNALSGMVDFMTNKPVIASPPYSEKFCGMDILSSLRMPSGVAPMVVLEEENTAIACIKILALKDKNLEKKLIEYKKEKIKEI